MTEGEAMFQCSFELHNQAMSAFRLGAISYAAFPGLGRHANQRAVACVRGTGPIPPGIYYIFDRQSGGQMNRFERLAFMLLTLLFSVFLTRWWLSTGMSESVWTWINDRIEGGHNPGLASDVELLIVLAGALFVSASGAMLIRLLLSRIRKKAGDDIR